MQDESITDDAHLARLEPLTPKPEASPRFFVDVLGITEIGQKVLEAPPVFPTRAAPARARWRGAERAAGYHTGVGEEGRWHRVDGRAGASVGMLSPRRPPARRPGGPQRRQVDRSQRKLRDGIPAGDGGVGKNIFITDPPRVARATAEAFAPSGVATIHEAQGRIGLLASHLPPIYPGAKLAGSAVTVPIAPADNWMSDVAVEHCRPGDVLLVAPPPPSDAGFFGELLACSFAARSVLGLVIEAGCCDVAALTQMRFPVWSRAITAQAADKETLGSVNVPLVCAAQLVHPGDLVVADDDGVAIVPRAMAEDVRRRGADRGAREKKIRARPKAGAIGLDIDGMREALAKKRLSYRPAGARE